MKGEASVSVAVPVPPAQERRTAARVAHFCRAQYCPSEDFVPRDGRITTLSERGAGMLVRDQRQDGERVTVNFWLPGIHDTMTITGVVRWSGSQLPKSRWYPLGLEWLPMEDVTRNRLRRFLFDQVQTSRAPAKPTVSPASPTPADQVPVTKRRKKLKLRLPSVQLPSATNVAKYKKPLVIVAGSLVLIGMAAILWITSLQWENGELNQAVQQRDTVIEQLEQQDQHLRQELDAARARLTTTVSEVSRLDQQAQILEKEMEQLSQDVEHFQDSYVRVREEREQLMQRVLDLEQERMALNKRLVFMEQLHQAIQEAIETHSRHQPRIYGLNSHSSDPLVEGEGNRGYLVRDGRPTIGRSTMWIKVHEPESLESSALTESN